jgi:hypothetical protein
LHRDRSQISQQWLILHILRSFCDHQRETPGAEADGVVAQAVRLAVIIESCNDQWAARFLSALLISYRGFVGNGSFVERSEFSVFIPAEVENKLK